MRCSRWQIGVDNQAEEGCAVAVQRHRQGWQLHHGRHLPFSLKALLGAILPQPWGRGETICEQPADFLATISHCSLAVEGASGGYFCVSVRNLYHGHWQASAACSRRRQHRAPCVATGGFKAHLRQDPGC